MIKNILITLITVIISTGLMQAQEMGVHVGHNDCYLRNAGDEGCIANARYQGLVDLVPGNMYFLPPGSCLHVNTLYYSMSAIDHQGVVSSDVNYDSTTRSLRLPLWAGVQLSQTDEDNTMNNYLAVGPTALLNFRSDLDTEQFTVQTIPAQQFLGGAAGAELGALFVEARPDVPRNDILNDYRSRSIHMWASSR